MDLVTKTIRDSTGLTLIEFCENYLDSDSRSFSARLRKNRLYPNEAVLICLLSGKKPIEIFERSTLETFFIKGKSNQVNLRIQELIDNGSAIEILAPDIGEKPAPVKKKLKLKSREKKYSDASVKYQKEIDTPIQKLNKPDFKEDMDTDFVDMKVFQ